MENNGILRKKERKQNIGPTDISPKKRIKHSAIIIHHQGNTNKSTEGYHFIRPGSGRAGKVFSYKHKN